MVLFLHEVGHLQNPEDLDIRSTFKRKYIQETKKDKLNRYPSSRLQTLKEEMDTVIRSERDAWAFALRQIRKLEKDFRADIFNKFPGAGKIIDRVSYFINECVRSYEEEYFEQFREADIFTRGQLEEHLDFLLKYETAQEEKIN